MILKRSLSGCLSYVPACLIGIGAPALAQSPFPPVMASQQSAPDPAAALLARIGSAARDLSYSGVFVHSSQERTTSRITHLSDHGDEWEKIETLDGPAQEIIRRNDEMYCYQPDSKTVRLDRRITGKFFPSLLNTPAATVQENYRLKLGGIERIGGHDCQWVALEPKDTLRYLQRLCAELNTGLLLRARTFNAREQMLEQFTFTQLAIGKDAARDFGRGHIKSSLIEKRSGWQTDDSAQREVKNTDTGWTVNAPPAGFRKIMEMKRTLAGKTQPVSHLVYSDGVASISVFVEPLLTGTKGFSKAAEDGMYSYALRPVGASQVTVLGEVPIDTAQLMANGVVSKGRSPAY